MQPGGLFQKYMRFMQGRYGWDVFNTFLMIVSFIVELLGRITRLSFVYYIGLAMFFYALYRMFSRNIGARVAENQKFINLRNRYANWRYFRQQRRSGQSSTYGGYGSGSSGYSRKQQRRSNERAGRKGGPVYCYYYCPDCKQQVRIPAGKGKVKITCPRCGRQFETYS